MGRRRGARSGEAPSNDRAQGEGQTYSVGLGLHLRHGGELATVRPADDAAPLALARPAPVNAVVAFDQG